MGSLVILVIPFTISAAVTNNFGVRIALQTTFLFFLAAALLLLIVAGTFTLIRSSHTYLALRMKKLTKEFADTSSTKQIIAQKTVWLTASAIPVVAFSIIIIIYLTEAVSSIERYLVTEWVGRASEVAFAYCLIMVVKRTDSAGVTVNVFSVDLRESTHKTTK